MRESITWLLIAGIILGCSLALVSAAKTKALPAADGQSRQEKPLRESVEALSRAFEKEQKFLERLSLEVKSLVPRLEKLEESVGEIRRKIHGK